MKKGFLKAIIGAFLSLSVMLAPVGTVAVQAVENVNTQTTVENGSSTQDTNLEFESTLKMAEGLDISKLDEESKSYYAEIEKGYKTYLERNKTNLSEDEIRKNVNLLFLLDTLEDISYDTFDKGMKHLGLNALDYLKIFLFGLDYNNDVETVDMVIATVEKAYNIVNTEAKNLYGEGDVAEATDTLWTLLNPGDISKFSKEDIFSTLYYVDFNFNEFTDLALKVTTGIVNDINVVEPVIAKLYENLLLRNVDEEGLKYWSSKFNEIVKSGKSKVNAVNAVANQIINSDEYKNLLAEFNKFVSDL